MAGFGDWFLKQPKNIRVRLALTALFIALVFGIAFSQSQNELDGPLAPTANSDLTPDEPLIQVTPIDTVLHVHVVGEVVQPGLYQLDFGSRVSDAVAAAGGFTSNAVETSVNLARQLGDGEQVVVLSISVENSDSQGGLVSLNRATAEELDALPGIGPALAERIISYRKESGGFSAVSQLQEVSGIGDKVFADIEPLVTL